MIISPPLVISKSEIDELISLAIKSLDMTKASLQEKGMLVAAK